MLRSTMESYKSDLAYIHDTGFGDFARNSAPGLLNLLEKSGIKSGLVIDLGCGSGIWAAELSRHGYDVLGIDISAAMIKIARKRVQNGEFRTESLLKARLPRCVAVTSLGECFNYLFDETNSIGQLRRLFRRVHSALQPGGLLIFDVAEPGRGKGPRQKHSEGPNWAVLVDVDENPSTNRLTRRIISFRQIGSLFRRDEEVHQLQLYKRTDVLKELRAAGFRARTIDHYGSQQMIDGCIAFVATAEPKKRNGRRIGSHQS
jgi:SAM-dependent methyltransferase